MLNRSIRHCENQNDPKPKRLRVTIEAKTVAVYFENIKSDPIGGIQNALTLSLPGWALLALGLLGSFVLKVISYIRLKQPIFATLSLLCIVDIPQFEIYAVTKKNLHCPLHSSKKTRRLNYGNSKTRYDYQCMPKHICPEIIKL